jgi:hypothetical protein
VAVVFAAFTLNPASTTNPTTPATDTGINQPPTGTGIVNATTPGISKPSNGVIITTTATTSTIDISIRKDPYARIEEWNLLVIPVIIKNAPPGFTADDIRIELYSVKMDANHLLSIDAEINTGYEFEYVGAELYYRSGESSRIFGFINKDNKLSISDYLIPSPTTPDRFINITVTFTYQR